MKFLYLTVAVFLFGTFALADTLEITETPNQPFIITSGSGITIHGRALNPPFFVLNNIELTWQSQKDLSLYMVTLKSLDPTLPAYDCVISGDELAVLFPSSTTNAGQVLLKPGISVSREIGCGNLPLPSPLPNTFNIPVEVKVSGLEGQTRVTATSIIHLQ